MAPDRPRQHVLADAAVNAFEHEILKLGWIWNPTRSGSDYGIDGFLTPTDNSGGVLPFEIPIQVKGVGKLGHRGEYGVAHPVTRESVDILRAHVICGYFFIYDQSTSTLYYCSAEAVGRVFDREGGRRKRLRIPLSNAVSQEALRDLRRRAEAEHLSLVEALRSDDAGQAGQRLLSALGRVHALLFEFLATLAFCSPDNLLLVQANWARHIAEDQGTRSVAELMDGWQETASEYEVSPPLLLLSNFPAASLMLTTMQLVIQELDRFVGELDPEHLHLAGRLGVPGLRSLVISALNRSFTTVDGKPLTTPDKVDPHSISLFRISVPHYFLSVAQLGLVVNSLMCDVNMLLVSQGEVGTDKGLRPLSIWIRHRSEEDGYVRSRPESGRGPQAAV